MCKRQQMLPASLGRADTGETRNPDCENIWRANGDGICAEIALEPILSSFLTVLHDPQRPDEVRRIEKSISRVLW